MKKEAVAQLFDKIAQCTILVIGDIMTDAYAWGHTDRMSPEAPVPVLHIRKTENRAGGAANVALNLLSLGAQVRLVSLVGEDEAGVQLRALLTEAGIGTAGLVASAQRPTTVKTRIMSGNQQLLRIDHESTAEANESESEALWKAFQTSIQGVDAVIFQDYDKGVLHQGNIPDMMAHCRSLGIPTAIDPKKRNFFTYAGADLFKPNLKELGDALGLPLDKEKPEGIDAAIQQLREKIHPNAILLTLSEAGVKYHSTTQSGHFPAHLRTIADVSGAGDTVIATAGCCLAAGLSLADLAFLSNLAGGLVCESLGVVPIKRDKLLAEALQNAE